MTGKGRRSSQRGFSLVETIAALGILSLAAIPLMEVATGAVQNTARLESRMLARTTAENILARAISDPEPVELGVTEGTEIQMGRPYRWELTVFPTERDALVRLEVLVNEESREQILARLMTLKTLPGRTTEQVAE